MNHVFPFYYRFSVPTGLLFFDRSTYCPKPDIKIPVAGGDDTPVTTKLAGTHGELRRSGRIILSNVPPQADQLSIFKVFLFQTGIFWLSGDKG